MGMLAGRYDRADAPPPGSRVARLGSVYAERVTAVALERAQALGEVARGADLDPAVMALAWVMQQPGVTAPIVGPRTEGHLDVAWAALETRLSQDLLGRINAVAPPGSSAADFFGNSGWAPGRGVPEAPRQ